MNRFDKIEDKLEGFIRKYYTNELLKGCLFFFTLGFLYFLFTLLIEYFFWLNSTGRAILFWLFVGIESVLLIKFIIIPFLRLFKLSKGIDYKDAANIIGRYFPEVNDKLINTLQLNSTTSNSELINASIEQKSRELAPIPFKLAINFKKNAKYLKYAAIPVLIFLLISVFNKDQSFLSSYNRVVNYNQAYAPPAPYQFFVLNQNLEAIENENFELEIRIIGDIIPEEVAIRFNNENYLLQQIAPGEYRYIFENPVTDTQFNLIANDHSSIPYTLKVVRVPAILDFEMELDYPKYTGKLKDRIKNTGNATIPEGTIVTWKIKARETDNIDLVLRNDKLNFALSEMTNSQKFFNISKVVKNNTEYSISTSNNQLKNHENLSYNLTVVKDEYPQIKMQSRRDTISNLQQYFLGNISDDYGLTKLRLVYFPSNSTDKIFKTIPISKSNVAQFIYAFPDNLKLQEGVNYEYYFEVFDNDFLNNYKSSKSPVYSFFKLTKDQLEQQQLKQQEKAIHELDKSLSDMKVADKELEKIAKTQKEKEKLSYNDQQKLKDFLDRQEQQEKLMKDFSKQLKENLNEFQKDSPITDEEKEILKERLERQELKEKQNEELLKQLQELREKLPKEKLTEKLEQLVKQNKNNKRNLEQMVELTKRYYVQKKSEQILDELQKLALKQEALSKKEGKENSKSAQDSLNKEFNTIEKALEELQKENQDLKRPLDLPNDAQKQNEVNQNQQDASEELQKQEQKDSDKTDKSNAQKSQQKAAQKMKEMSSAMAQQMQMSGEQSLEEDVAMLRQILDNLLVFSFEEENLMNVFRDIDSKNPNYAARLKRQNTLKQNFKHVDDSLYALALRQPKLDELINETLVDIDYSMNKALERLAENKISQGVSSQQYVISGTNTLADLLSESLDEMQNAMMSGSGSGDGKGMPKPGSGSGKGEQLPDIIQSQEELNKQMSKGSQPKPGGGESGSSSGEIGSENKGDSTEDGKGEDKGSSSQSGKGKGEGNGKSDNQESNDVDDYEQGLLYEIYKGQAKLRQQLEDAIKNEGLGGDAQKLVKDMEGVEKQLLEKGFSSEVMKQMNNLKHELLKLKSASLQQGEEVKRKSTTSSINFSNPLNNAIDKARKYFNTTEILSRNALPLKDEYKKKVQDYFQNNNDRI